MLVDFSEHSEWLLSFSSKWAKEVNAELLLIHCSLVLVSGMADHDVREQAMRSSERTTLEKLQSYAHGILGADPTIQFKIESHNLAAALLDLQQHDVTDYVLVGMNDKSPIENFFIGNTASVLAEELNSIIIALPTFRHDFSFERLYIGVKHSYQLKDTELQSLLSIRKNIIEQLNFVNVLKPGEPH